jgi:WD40 repeat protein
VHAEGTVGGPAVAGGFLVMAAGACYRVGPDLAEAEPVASELPDRGDLFAAPDGRRLVVSGLTPARQVLVELIDLEGETKDRLLPPERSAHATAVAWSPDGKRVAVGWALLTAARRAPFGLRLYDLDGSVLRTWPAHAADLPVRSITFAFDARSLTVASGKLRRLDAQTGEVLAEADVQPLHWGQIDPVVALSVQADGITFWDADRLRPARTIPIDEEPLAVRDRRVGPVLNAVLSPRGDLLAVGTARGLRIYRIRT